MSKRRNAGKALPERISGVAAPAAWRESAIRALPQPRTGARARDATDLRVFRRDRGRNEPDPRRTQGRFDLEAAPIRRRGAALRGGPEGRLGDRFAAPR